MNRRLIKGNIISLVSAKTGYTHSMVERIINSTLETITEALSGGVEVQFADFGIFEPKRRAARTGRNPHTKEPVPIPARVVPSFKAGKRLKEAVTVNEVTSYE